MISEQALNSPGTVPGKLTKHDNKVILCGYVLLLASAFLYALGEYIDVGREGNDLSIFFVHYVISIAYVIILSTNDMYGVVHSWYSENIDKTVVALNLFLVSAYALNREIPVFEDSVEWLCVYLIVSSAATLSYRYYEVLPSVVNKIQQFFLGGALVLYSYLALFIGNFYIQGFFGIILLGIGGHILVPIFLIIACIIQARQAQRIKKDSYSWMIAGALVVLVSTGSFIYIWNTKINAIERSANQSVLYPDTEVPVWVKVSESVQNSWITERILKSELVYSVSNEHLNWDFMPSRSWEEQRKHDPFVFLSSMIRKPLLSQEERIKILQATTDSRHRTEERLWSGDNLKTSYVVTDVDIYPDLRLAYTEQYLNIRNDDTNRRWWGSSQEAIYKFQLPEGSVVTSLSLWVNGKEEKAILTSKQKATEAYTTVVGKERRDPSVAHWQEGNTVSVRVFPCTKDEERKFKIGITSPLSETNGRITYNNVAFLGPNPSGATETRRLRFIGKPADLKIPSAFEKNVKGDYLSEQTYDSDLAVSWAAAPLRANQFGFDGFAYSLAPYKPTMESLNFTAVYLDINNSWTKSETEALLSLISKRGVYAFFEDEFIQLDEENWKEVTERLLERNFSLFPFHHVKDIEHSLVVTKGKALSPYLRDFKDSKFADSIRDFFAANKKVYVFNLAGGTSTYVKSLKELRGFNFATGEVAILAAMLDKNEFPASVENQTKVVLYDANMVIEKKPADTIAQNTAPDHLVRLFAYNDIMRQVGPQFFRDDFINQALVHEAAAAYVVSPVSSLIVLETQADYERFGIKDIDNSLGNATRQSSGAVPEPHEWALIVLFLSFVLFTISKRYRAQPVQNG
jgi:XrtN system VIT domain protein